MSDALVAWGGAHIGNSKVGPAYVLRLGDGLFVGRRRRGRRRLVVALVVLEHGAHEVEETLGLDELGLVESGELGSPLAQSLWP